MDVFYLCTWITYRQMLVICLRIFSVTTHLPTYGKNFLPFCSVPSSVGCQKQLAHIFLCFRWWLFWCAGFLFVIREKNYRSNKDISSLLLRCPIGFVKGIISHTADVTSENERLRNFWTNVYWHKSHSIFKRSQCDNFLNGVVTPLQTWLVCISAENRSAQNCIHIVNYNKTLFTLIWCSLTNFSLILILCDFFS